MVHTKVLFSSVSLSVRFHCERALFWNLLPRRH